MTRKELLFLSIAIFLTVLAWLFIDIHTATTLEKIKVKEEIPTLKEYQIKTDLLNNLKSKNQ